MFSPLPDAAALYGAVDRLKRHGGANWTSSLFASPAQIARWAEQGELLWQETAETILVQKRDKGFSRIYHVSAGIAPLQQALSGIECDLPIVADLVGEPEILAPVTDAYEAAAFCEHSSLVRMARMGNPFPDAQPGGTQGVDIAGLESIDALERFFLQFLDPFADQIPTKEDLRRAVEQRSILTVGGSGQLGAVLVFERTGMTSLLRYWYVDPVFHNRGIGARLMKRFFSLCADCRRFLLWVAENNSDSISKYKHYGFAADRLTDRILVRRAA